MWAVTWFLMRVGDFDASEFVDILVEEKMLRNC